MRGEESEGKKGGGLRRITIEKKILFWVVNQSLLSFKKVE